MQPKYKNVMYKKIFTILLAAGFCMGSHAEDNDKDTLRVCDLDELIIVSQPKESFILREWITILACPP